MRCSQGLDHGTGTMAWMHPPVHRLLGWVTVPSLLSLSRDVWRLDQIRGIGKQEIYVKGNSSIAEQETLNSLPTLIDSALLNKTGNRIGSIVDMVFELASGKILYYLISRSDPRIPGTSRWKLIIDKILDQQPGFVSVDFSSIDEIPLIRSSIRQDFLKKTKTLRNQIQDFSDKATDRLEGWLEDPPWEEPNDTYSRFQTKYDNDPLDNWDEDQLSNDDLLDSSNKSWSSQDFSERSNNQEDPWV